MDWVLLMQCQREYRCACTGKHETSHNNDYPCLDWIFLCFFFEIHMLHSTKTRYIYSQKEVKKKWKNRYKDVKLGMFGETHQKTVVLIFQENLPYFFFGDAVQLLRYLMKRKCCRYFECWCCCSNPAHRCPWLSSRSFDIDLCTRFGNYKRENPSIYMLCCLFAICFDMKFQIDYLLFISLLFVVAAAAAAVSFFLLRVISCSQKVWWWSSYAHKYLFGRTRNSKTIWKKVISFVIANDGKGNGSDVNDDVHDDGKTPKKTSVFFFD